MEQKSVHQFIYKIESKILKNAKWNLKLPLDKAIKNCPEVIVSLNDSQCLRFIDEINGIQGRNEEVRNIQNKIRKIKKKEKSRENKILIKKYYDRLYELQFQRDYICVIMNSESDYDRANLGFTIDYGLVDGKECKVTYRRLLGTNGGIKNSTIVYVNQNIYDKLKAKIDNGRNMNVKLVPAKLEAYQALVCSGSIPLPMPKGFIVVKDCITKFKENVYLIDDSVDGEPKLTYEENYEIEHNDSDGYGLMLPSYSKKVNEYLTGKVDKTVSGMNIRYAWTKGMLYTFDFIEFAENVAGTYEIVDVWGQKRDIRDAEVILTESMLKLWSSYDSWEDYFNNCEKNHYQFSATKTTPDKLESVRDTNYQFLQSYEFTDEELYELCKPTIDEIKDVLGLDYRKSLAFLCGFNLNDDNVFNDNTADFVKALMIEPNLINDPFIRKKIYRMIKKRIEMGMKGSIRINANYAMISGDLFALAQSMFGLKVTGLLKAHEVYHKYWIDKGANEIVCFRAPMTCHNNIRKMTLSKSEEAAYWYRYVDTALIFNAFDSACEAMNGADKDGDTNMCTDNPIIVRNTKNTPTIICLQKKANKIIPTESDIIQANKLAFNDDIGIVTNHITSMFEVQAGFDKDSIEYKTLSYRIMCGQLYQQNTIDRAKGIIAKPMPEYWFSSRGLKNKNNNLTEEQKSFNMRIMASHKPYFMAYVYPKLRLENNKYIKNRNSDAIRRFAKYGINNISDLEKYKNKTPEMNEFCKYSLCLSPAGNNSCVVNRICWIFEREFKNYISKISKLERNCNKDTFDYKTLKNSTEYSKSNYQQIYCIYQSYIETIKKYHKRKEKENRDAFDEWIERQKLIYLFKNECYKICPNDDELSNIIIDMCGDKETSKQFIWDICGKIIIENLLSKNNKTISYPYAVEDNEDFIYCGVKFKMNTLNMEEN